MQRILLVSVLLLLAHDSGAQVHNDIEFYCRVQFFKAIAKKEYGLEKVSVQLGAKYFHRGEHYNVYYIIVDKYILEGDQYLLASNIVGDFCVNVLDSIKTDDGRQVNNIVDITVYVNHVKIERQAYPQFHLNEIKREREREGITGDPLIKVQDVFLPIANKLDKVKAARCKVLVSYNSTQGLHIWFTGLVSLQQGIKRSDWEIIFKKVVASLQGSRIENIGWRVERIKRTIKSAREISFTVSIVFFRLEL
jgi:hypothetical protein